MALATYTDLLASIAAWMDRTDLTATIPDFVALAESRIARDLRIRRQISTASLSTVAGTVSVALPSDFLEIENITLSSTSPPATLSVVTPEILDRKYPAGYLTGQPAVYTILGDNLLLGPTPDAVYTVSMDYYARMPALSVTPTNWLLTNYPSVYLSGALVEAAMYLRSTDDIALFDARYRAEVKQVQDTDDVALRSGSQMRVRVLYGDSVANQSGTVTSSMGAVVLGSSPNDAITFTPSSGTYTVEYPLGTVVISGSAIPQSLPLQGGQLRISCASGSVAYGVSDGIDIPTVSVFSRTEETAQYPDPRRAAGVRGHFILPGQTAQVLPIGRSDRLIAVTTNATNSAANCSVSTNLGKDTLAVSGATDAVLLQIADIDRPRPVVKATTGANAIALIVEIQQ